MSTFLGVDTGGTFTDFVLLRDGRLSVHKVLSTPDAPERAILQGIAELGLDATEFAMTHGSTVATNALLERKGARTVYVTNQGFGDTLIIGRQARQKLFDLANTAPPTLVDPELCVEVAVRRADDGSELVSLSDDALAALVADVEALAPESIAINLLFSFVDGHDEARIRDALKELALVSCSHEVLPEAREYERGMATWMNAYVGPKIEGYIRRLVGGAPSASISVMQSAGGCVDVDVAARLGVHLLLSGPAGGVMGAQAAGARSCATKLLTFDMGGTSTDVALIDGEIALTGNGQIGDWPVAVPMVDMHTIGAGGGSIAFVDDGGMLCVGPRSAGAVPGPACYGQGGKAATVTDANLILKRIVPEAFLGGGMSLDCAAADAAVGRLAEALGVSIDEAAQGIIDVANEHMAQALRVMSISKGVDPAEFTLMSFGGAGGLHVCALARRLGMRSALVPASAGVLSAYGMLAAPYRRHYSQTVNLAADDAAGQQQAFTILRDKAVHDFEQAGHQLVNLRQTADVRYFGQTHTLNVAWTDATEGLSAFSVAYKKRFRHLVADGPVEIVNIRLEASSECPEIDVSSEKYAEPRQRDAGDRSCIRISGFSAIYDRAQMTAGTVVKGPAIITEKVATTWVADGWQACKDAAGNLQLIDLCLGETDSI